MFSAEFVNGFTESMSPGRVEIGSLEDPLVNDEGAPLIVLVERRMEIHAWKSITVRHSHMLYTSFRRHGSNLVGNLGVVPKERTLHILLRRRLPIRFTIESLNDK